VNRGDCVPCGRRDRLAATLQSASASRPGFPCINLTKWRLWLEVISRDVSRDTSEFRDSQSQPPIMTVGQHGGITWPLGAGIGATHVAWRVGSFIRAAGRPLIRVVVEPIKIIPGPAGMHPASIHGIVVSVIRAAGIPPIMTVGAQGEMICRGIGG
jgi:hypothetical protein